MAEILVSGYYGFHNAGDEAILAGILGAIREVAPETTFTVISGTAASTRQVHGVQAVSRGDIKQIWKAVGRADLLLSGGGSLLQDVTSSRSLTYYLSVISAAKARWKPVMFYAQGIGPITGMVGKALIPVVGNAVDLITVRDRESAETLRRLGIRRPEVKVTADPALALGPSDPDWGALLLKEAGVDLARPIIGVSVRPWKEEQPMEPGLALALDQLVRETGAQVAFLPMQQRHDVEAARVVAGLMESPSIVVQGEFAHTHVQAMIARCDLLIGLRYHALVFAAMNGVPLVGLSYDPKNDSFLRLIGEKVAGSTRHLDPANVVAVAHKALADAPAIRARLLAKVAELAPLARQNAEMAVELLRTRESR